MRHTARNLRCRILFDALNPRMEVIEFYQKVEEKSAPPDIRAEVTLSGKAN